MQSFHKQHIFITLLSTMHQSLFQSLSFGDRLKCRDGEGASVTPQAKELDPLETLLLNIVLFHECLS